MGASVGDSLLLVYQGQPPAVLEIEEIYTNDKELLADRSGSSRLMACPL